MTMPGSAGERALQERLGTAKRARGFYENQMLDRPNPAMREFIGRQEMMWVATADAHGDCDCTFRVGPLGFVRAVDDRRVAYPEYRGNGVLASLGNITENAHIGLLFLDFFDSTVGLHVNGRARVLENPELLRDERVTDEVWVALFAAGGQYAERWVMVDVDEAYIHCAKHVPLLAKRDKHIDWGTDDEIRAVAEIADEVVFETGHELVRQGDPVGRFLVLLAGRAEVRRGRRVVNELSSGDFVGEIGLVSRSPATATVTALEPVQALAVTTLAFRALLRRVPSLTDRVLEALAARTR